MTKQEIKKIICEKQFLENNEWLDKYCALLANNSNTTRVKNITQCHHIIPAYYFKHRDIDVDNSNNNLIYLQYKDHILAHYYLANCSINILDKYSNIVFLNFALNMKNIDIQSLQLDENLLAELQSIYIEVNRLNHQIRHEKSVAKKQKQLQLWVDEKHICKSCGKVMTEKYGKGEYCCKKCASTHSHSEETKLLLSEMNRAGIFGNKGKHFSEEHKEKLSKSHKGKSTGKWCNNGIENKKYDGINLPEGFVKGRIKGKQVAWNKGLTKDDPRVAKNLENRANTMMKKYNTLNGHEVHKIKEGD